VTAPFTTSATSDFADICVIDVCSELLFIVRFVQTLEEELELCITEDALEDMLDDILEDVLEDMWEDIFEDVFEDMLDLVPIGGRPLSISFE
jgi:hypothetical protein